MGRVQVFRVRPVGGTLPIRADDDLFDAGTAMSGGWSLIVDPTEPHVSLIADRLPGVRLADTRSGDPMVWPDGARLQIGNHPVGLPTGNQFQVLPLLVDSVVVQLDWQPILNHRPERSR